MTDESRSVPVAALIKAALPFAYCTDPICGNCKKHLEDMPRVGGGIVFRNICICWRMFPERFVSVNCGACNGCRLSAAIEGAA